MAAAKFAIIAHVAIQARCHSVISVNLYSPCRFAARSGFATASNSKIPSQKRFPFVKSVIKSGSQASGTGALNFMSFLSPNCCHVQNFVSMSVSKL